MIETVESQLTCPECRYENSSDAKACSLCGSLLKKAPPRPLEAPPMHEPVEVRTPKVLGMGESYFFLLVGMVLAPILTFTPLLNYMGWFLASLTHEMGHSISAWFFGCPAFPAIRLDGHAAAVHQQQIPLLAWGVMAALAYGAWHFRSKVKLLVVFSLCALIYPALAFTQAKDVFHLFAGHLGELAFVVICVWRAMSGGFSSSPIERGAYAMVGWYLAARNFYLCWGLIFSAASRAMYASSGSFGLTNDYLRLAQDYFSTSVQSIALIMLVFSVLSLPLGMLIWRFTKKCSH